MSTKSWPSYRYLVILHKAQNSIHHRGNKAQSITEKKILAARTITMAFTASSQWFLTNCLIVFGVTLSLCSSVVNAHYRHWNGYQLFAGNPKKCQKCDICFHRCHLWFNNAACRYPARQ